MTKDKEYRGEELLFPRDWYGPPDTESHYTSASTDEMDAVLEMVELEFRVKGPEWEYMTEDQKMQIMTRIKEIRDRYCKRPNADMDNQTSVDDGIPF